MAHSPPSQPPPSKRATIADVARLAGVSISTVSRVVNGTAPVAADTDQDVRRAIDCLGYTPSAAARSLASQRTNTIGLLLPVMSAAFFLPLVRGIEAAAHDAGYDLLVHLALGAHGNGRSHLRPVMSSRNTDGLIVFTNRINDEDIRQLWRTGTPTVLLFRSAPSGIEMPTIRFENRAGAYQAVEHLIVAHGRRRILFLAGPADNEDAQQRASGYRQALQSHGIDHDPALVRTADFDHRIARHVVADLLRRGMSFDAIFAANDETAAGAMSALGNGGIRVPTDVSVIGFDDADYSSFLTPSLTTMRAPIEKAGRCAVNVLIDLIRGESATDAIVLPTTLAPRQSCGCCGSDSYRSM